jgi:hypothetical protein
VQEGVDTSFAGEHGYVHVQVSHALKPVQIRCGKMLWVKTGKYMRGGSAVFQAAASLTARRMPYTRSLVSSLGFMSFVAHRLEPRNDGVII